MLSKYSSWSTIAWIACLLLLAAGCSGNGSGGAPVQESGANESAALPPEPVTLKVFVQSTLTPEVWDSIVKEPVQKKFPHITLEETHKKDNNTIVEMTSAGYKPDFLIAGFSTISLMSALDIPLPLDDLLKAGHVDATRLEPVALSALRSYDKEGKLVSLPFYINKNILWYNRDLFDKFGVPYPQDGMTWDQSLELSRRMTRTDGGVQYFGIGASWDEVGSQLSLPKIDVATNKSAVNSDGFKKVLTMLNQMYHIVPGMDATLYGQLNSRENLFLQNRTLAMATGWISGMGGKLDDLRKTGNAVNFDVATLPHFPEKPNVGFKVDSHILMMNKNGTQQHTAFEVVKFLVTSAEAQTAVSRGGRVSVINDAQVQQLFAEDLQISKGTRLREVVLKTVMAPLPPYHPLEGVVYGTPMSAALRAVIVDKVDVNTALRNAEEDMNKRIVAEMAK